MNKKNNKDDSIYNKIINFLERIISPKKEDKLLENSTDSNIAIELRNVSLSFKIGNDKIDNLKEYIIRTLNRTKEKKTIFKATDDVSFKIYKGEKVGILGFNGAGKSTLLKIISGVYTPDEGEVIINGNIAPLLSLGAGFDKNYSSGMLSKLGFSIATIVNPDILILDEVLGVGDITFRKKSKEKLQSLMESNTTVLLVSHSIKEIRNICDKAIWIDKGKVLDIGEVNSVCDRYEEAAKNVSKEKTKKLKPQRF